MGLGSGLGSRLGLGLGLGSGLGFVYLVPRRKAVKERVALHDGLATWPRVHLGLGVGVRVRG